MKTKRAAVAPVVVKPLSKKPLATKPAAVKPIIVQPALMRSTKPVAHAATNGSLKPAAAKPAVLAATVKPSPAKLAPPKFEPVIIPDSRVATNLKPRKNQAGLGAKELESFRASLLQKRREILGDMSSMESEALGSNGGGLSTLPVHMADMGTDNYEQEFTLGLVEKDRVLLREINQALAKIQNGAYGICEGTGNAIGKPRLEVQPWARYSIEYARQLERNGRGIR